MLPPHQILIYSDSTCLPRPDSVDANETWPNRLRSFLGWEIPIYIRGFAGADSNFLSNILTRDSHYFELNNNRADKKKLVILFVGIVDSAVYPFTYRFAKAKRIPLIGKFIWENFIKFVHPFRNQLQKFWSYRPVDEWTFDSNIRRMLSSMQSSSVTILLVLHPIPHRTTESRSPGWGKSAKQYNEIKKVISKSYNNVMLVDLTDFPPELYLTEEDGHHFDKYGHEWVAIKILNVFVKSQNQKLIQ